MWRPSSSRAIMTENGRARTGSSSCWADASSITGIWRARSNRTWSRSSATYIPRFSWGDGAGLRLKLHALVEGPRRVDPAELLRLVVGHELA